MSTKYLFGLSDRGAIETLRIRRRTGMTACVSSQLRRLREEHLQINLTISLHATTDEVRHRLIPGAGAFTIEDVVAKSQNWAERHNRAVTYVYLLLPDVNDTGADADRLVDLLGGRRARVNLMRWNPVVGGDQFRRVDDERLSWFRRRLDDAGIPTVVRDTQGKDIDAACGQLWLRDLGG